MPFKQIAFFQWVAPILILTIIFALAPASALNAEINWNSYNSGMKKIADGNQKGFLHFYTDWCTYC